MVDTNADRRKQEIIDAYFEYFNSYTARDWKSMVSRFSESLTFFGTGIDEVSLNCDDTINFYKREFEQAPLPLEFTIKKLQVFELTDDLAYIMMLKDLRFKMEDELVEYSNNRTTAIMRKENGAWKLLHGHWSQPTEIQDFGESVPYKLLKERNIVLEQKVKERTQEIEKQNIELKKLINTKTNLLSIISHDLRSPFNAFLGLSELMLSNFDENINNPEYFKSRLKLIHERAHNLYRVADNLLNWAWTQTDEIVVKNEPIMLTNLVDEQIIALKDTATAKNIIIDNNLDEKIQLISDSEILSIIIRNTISNAIKYSFRDGKVIISAKETPDRISFSVKDFGVGMNEEQLNNVIKTNYMESNPGTEKEKGTGLGLLICKELIKKVNGTLRIISAPNQGTEITIEIDKQAKS